MDKKVKIRILLSTIVCLIPIIFGLVVYNKLPDQLAVHFDSYGEANGYLGRMAAVFLLPVFLAVINVVVQVGIEYDPKKSNQLPLMKSFTIWLVPILSLAVQSYILLYALDKNINVSSMIEIGVGILFIIIGNYLPKCRQNYTIGIKLPWTLHDSDNWNKTHRLAGVLWVIGGILMIISSLLSFNPNCMVVIIIVLVIIPTIYSFMLYKKTKS